MKKKKILLKHINLFIFQKIEYYLITNHYYILVMVCDHDSCLKMASFNYEGYTKKLYCFTHKLPNMVNVRHGPCYESNCKTRPVFNFKHYRNGKYCKVHKSIGMIDVRTKLCEHKTCKIQPTFNFVDKPGSKYCDVHKEIGMVNKKRVKI